MAGVQFNPTQARFPSGSGGGVAPVRVGVNVIQGDNQPGPTTAAGFYEGGMSSMPPIAIPQFLSGIMEEQREERRQRQEWEGYTAAVEGETLAEVRKDTPWYVRAFGPTNFETGIAMYESTAKQANLATQWMQEMPELRKESSAVVQQKLIQRINENMTGDPLMDTMLRKQAMQIFAPLIEQHTKAKIAYDDERAVVAQVEKANSLNTLYQEARMQAATLGKDHPDQPTVQSNIANLSALLSEAWSPSKFQSPESVKRFFDSNIRQVLRNGQFYVMEDAIDKGLLNQLPAEEAERVMKAYDAAQLQWQSKAAFDDPEFVRLTGYVAAGKNFPIGDKLQEMMDDVNRYWASRTGSRTPYYSLKEMADARGQATAAWIRERDKLDERAYAEERKRADERADELDRARNAEQIGASFASGSAGEMLLNGMSEGEVNRSTKVWFDTQMQRNPKAAIGAVVWNSAQTGNGEYVNPLLAKQLQGAIKTTIYAGGGSWSDAFEREVETYQMFKTSKGWAFKDGAVVEGDESQGKAAAIKYYDEELSTDLDNYLELTRTGTPRDMAFSMIFGPEAQAADFRAITPDQSKTNRQEFLKALDAQDAGWFSRTFGDGTKLHPSARMQLAEIAGDRYGRLGGGFGFADVKAAEAIKLATAERAEVIGGFLLTSAKGQKKLSQWMERDSAAGRWTTARTSVLFAQTIQARAKELGIDNLYDHEVRIGRTQDDDGVPQFGVLVYTDKGTKMFPIRGTDLEEREKATTVRQQELASPAARRKLSETVQTNWDYSL